MATQRRNTGADTPTPSLDSADRRSRLAQIEKDKLRLQIEGAELERAEAGVVGSLEWWKVRGTAEREHVQPLIDRIGEMERDREQGQEDTGKMAEDLTKARATLDSLRAELTVLARSLNAVIPHTRKGVEVNGENVCINCGMGGSEDDHEETCVCEAVKAVKEKLEELAKESQS